jgi:hypothetical protein
MQRWAQGRCALIAWFWREWKRTIRVCSAQLSGAFLGFAGGLFPALAKILALSQLFGALC